MNILYRLYINVETRDMDGDQDKDPMQEQTKCEWEDFSFMCPYRARRANNGHECATL